MPALLRRTTEMAPEATSPAPVRVDEPILDDHMQPARGWNVVVWNDPVNLMSYVVWVFRRLFGYPEDEATRLMLAVHHEGRAIVATEPRERAEFHVQLLHRHALWATMEEA